MTEQMTTHKSAMDLPSGLSRRNWLLGAIAAATLPGLGGCSTPLPLDRSPGLPKGGANAAVNPAANAAAANARLMASALAHGLPAYRQLNDINVAYDGEWQPLIGRIQPEIVDAGYRIRSEERLMPRLGINAQRYQGPKGHKQVWWQRANLAAPASVNPAGEVAVWFNGQASSDPSVLSASALVAEIYGLFLLGPLWLADRNLPAELDGTERVDGRLCDVLHLWVSPGFGQVGLDRLSLCIDRDNHITRRMRFTLEGFAGTRGAVAETDTFDHQRRDGILWPMRSFERVLHPIRLPAHDWRITGLDINRGYGPEQLRGPSFGGVAAQPAQAVRTV